MKTTKPWHFVDLFFHLSVVYSNQKEKTGARQTVYCSNLISSIGLGFLTPTSQLKPTDVIAFCMQLGNSEDRLQHWWERGCYLSISERGKGWEIPHFVGVLRITRTYTLGCQIQKNPDLYYSTFSAFYVFPVVLGLRNVVFLFFPSINWSLEQAFIFGQNIQYPSKFEFKLKSIHIKKGSSWNKITIAILIFYFEI